MKSEKKTPKISVVIPCYNLDNIIETSVENIIKNLQFVSGSFEIIIIDDGSTDNTLDIIENLKKQYNFIQIISYSQNKGKGHAVKRGILESIGSSVMYIDGDSDIGKDSIKSFIQELENFDLVIGSKSAKDSIIKVRKSRKILSDIFSSLVKYFTGIKIQDTQVGLKLGNGDDLRKIFKMIKIDGFAFDVELILIASKLNLRIKEMPVQLKVMRGFRLKSALNMLWELLVITYREKMMHTYDKEIKKHM